MLSCVIAFTEFLITAKTESERLNIDFREILRIKMIEYVILSINFINLKKNKSNYRNLVGITINAQRQIEFGRVENESDYNNPNEEDEIIEHYTQYQLQKPQSDV